MEYPEQFSVIEDRSLHRNSWKTLLKYWEQRENCPQRIILKLIDKQKESTRKYERSYDTM